MSSLFECAEMLRMVADRLELNSDELHVSVTVTHGPLNAFNSQVTYSCSVDAITLSTSFSMENDLAAEDESNQD